MTQTDEEWRNSVRPGGWFLFGLIFVTAVYVLPALALVYVVLRNI